MSNTTSQEKGDALENAVHAIESAILRTFPNYSEETFKIERKKYVISEGVRHEIDIYVTVELGKGYSSVFIFECKNWKEKVNKNEIVIFIEKIKVSKAQKGFFVAKSYTKDAIAQAKKEERLELLLASEVDPSIELIPAGFHAIQVNPPNCQVIFHLKNNGNIQEKKKNITIDIPTAKFSIDGEKISLIEYLNEWANELSKERSNRFNSTEAQEGPNELEISDNKEFINEEVIINEKNISKMELTGTVNVNVYKGYVVSVFEVETRGRVVSVKVDMPSGDIQADFIGLSED